MHGFFFSRVFGHFLFAKTLLNSIYGLPDRTIVDLCTVKTIRIVDNGRIYRNSDKGSEVAGISFIRIGNTCQRICHPLRDNGEGNYSSEGEFLLL